MTLPEGIESMGDACNTAFSSWFVIMSFQRVIFFLSDVFIIPFVAGLGTD